MAWLATWHGSATALTLVLACVFFGIAEICTYRTKRRLMRQHRKWLRANHITMPRHR